MHRFFASKGLVRRHPGWKGPIAGLAATLLLLVLGAASARAGTYDVQACKQATGYANNSWRASADRGMLAYTACPAGDDLRRGMVVRNEVGAGEVRDGDGATMRFKAPDGARLAGLTFDWDGYRANGEWSLGFSDGDSHALIAGCRAGSPSLGASCRVGDPRSSGSPSYLGLRGADAVRLEATCGRQGGCDAGSTHQASTGNTQARLRLTSAAVRVEDFSAPVITPVGAGLWDGRWKRGTVTGEYRAADNVGIRTTRLAVDGTPLRTDQRECDYTERVPCANLAGQSYRVDTAALADGAHEVTVTGIDAAANAADLRRPLRVDNHAPGPIDDLSVEGGEAVRATNSFDLRFTTPEGQVAPITRAHYRLCPAGEQSGCTVGSAAVVGERLAGVSVPRRGDHTLAVWLEDEAGNADPSARSNRVHLRFDDRSPTSLSAGIIGRRGDAVAEDTVGHGERPLIRGRLTGATGTRYEGQRVMIVSRPRGSHGGFTREAGAALGRTGAFEARVDRGPSRTVRAVYRGSDADRPSTSSDMRLAVRAKSTIRVSRHSARNGQRARFSGRLAGRPSPRAGKLVELQAFYRGRWRAFKVVRADRRGRWSARYRFGGTRGVVTYPFRAFIREQASYPYAAGTSRAVEVTVRER